MLVANHAKRANTLLMEKTGGQRFSELLIDLGVGPSEFAILMDYTRTPDKSITTKVSQWKKRGIPRHQQRHICKKLEEKKIGSLNPDWLAEGLGKRWLHKHTGSAMIEEEESPTVNVQCFDTRPDTAIAEHHAQCTIKELIIHEEWLQRSLRVGQPGSIAIREMRGDTMHPVIKDGEIMFIDVSATRVETDGIYLVEVDGDLFVKHVARFPGKLKFSSGGQHNKNAFEVRKTDFERIRVHGRIVGSWALRRL